MLNRLCGVGHLYSDLEQFVLNDQKETTIASVALGLYRQAVRTGIDEQLQKYRALLLSIENKVLSEPKTPISYLYQSLADWHLLLPAFTKVVHRIVVGEVHGCRVLDVLDRAASQGIPLINNAFAQVATTSRRVLVGIVQTNIHGVCVSPTRSINDLQLLYSVYDASLCIYVYVI